MLQALRVMPAVLASLVALHFHASIAAAEPAGAPRSSSLMAISSEGAILACTNRDSGSVTIVDLKTNQKLREIDLGGHSVKPVERVE